MGTTAAPADSMQGADERVFRAHLTAAPFRSGTARGKWRLVSVEWPVAIIALIAAPRDGVPEEYALRFDMTGYPQVAPTATLWDLDRAASLAPALWPGGTGRVPAVFRPDWNAATCLYLPCDRVAFSGHDAWRTQHPHLIWRPASDITLYLEAVYDLLHSSGYTGRRRS